MTAAGKQLCEAFGFCHYTLKRGDCVLVPLTEVVKCAHLLEDVTTDSDEDYFSITSVTGLNGHKKSKSYSS